MAAVANTSTPSLDDAMRRLSDAANYSRLSLRRGRAAPRSAAGVVASPQAVLRASVRRPRLRTPCSSRSATVRDRTVGRGGAGRPACADARHALVPLGPHRGGGGVRVRCRTCHAQRRRCLYALAAAVGYFAGPHRRPLPRRCPRRGARRRRHRRRREWRAENGTRGGRTSHRRPTETIVIPSAPEHAAVKHHINHFMGPDSSTMEP